MSRRTPGRRLSFDEAIQSLAARPLGFTAPEVAARTGTSRQAVHRRLARLVAEGHLTASGRARGTRYRLVAATAPPPPTAKAEPGVGSAATPATEPARWSRSLATAGLEEDRVWSELEAAFPELGQARSAGVRAILGYAFTEMLNNAIDHSRAPTATVRAGATATSFWFEVDDRGVGAFENVRSSLGLPDQLAALQEISKGKISTLPERHSGEGLFFTSKMADRFELSANGLAWLVDNLRQDQAVGTAAPRPGTLVRFEVAADKAERPESVFARYTHDFEFDTTRTVVRLFEHGVRFVSRSEAKRLVQGLERFRQVVVDFSGVEAVGQGFADEVFRVWAQAHPGIDLRAENMSPPVAFMVDRSRARS